MQATSPCSILSSTMSSNWIEYYWVLWEILCSSNRVTISVYIVRVFLVHRASSLLHPHLTVQHWGGVCVCEIKYINQLHPARMGYGSCWVFPPLFSSQILSPNDISPHRSAGSCRQGGAPRYPSPHTPPRRKRNIKAKRQRERERENASNRRESTVRFISSPGDGPPRPLPFKQSGGGGWPPLLPFHSSLIWGFLAAQFTNKW